MGKPLHFFQVNRIEYYNSGFILPSIIRSHQHEAVSKSNHVCEGFSLCGWYCGWQWNVGVGQCLVYETLMGRGKVMWNEV